MNYKIYLFILLFFSTSLFGTEKFKRIPFVKLDIKGFESQDKKLITNLFKQTGWYQISSLLDRKKLDIKISITRQSIYSVQITIQKQNKKPIILTTDTHQLYGRILVSKIVNITSNKIFGDDNFNSLASSKISFSALNEDRQRNIYTIEIDGQELSQETSLGNSTNPTWGRTNKELFYNFKSLANTSLVSINIEQRNHKLFSYFNGINTSAKINPQKSQLVLCLDANRTIDLYTMSLDTENFQLDALTNDSNSESSPSWSPNGTNICYTSSKIKNGIIQLPKLKIINVITKKEKELFPETDDGFYDPDWSKKGIIAYTRKINNSFVIFTTDPLKKSNQKAISIKSIPNASWTNPSWAPDSRHLVCLNKNQPNKLFIIDTWHNTVKSIKLNGIYQIEAPSWSSSTL